MIDCIIFNMFLCLNLSHWTILCANALASSDVEHMLYEGFRNAGLDVSYRIDEKVLRKDLKRLVLTVDHGRVKVSISVELVLRLLRNESRLTSWRS